MQKVYLARITCLQFQSDVQIPEEWAGVIEKSTRGWLLKQGSNYQIINEGDYVALFPDGSLHRYSPGTFSLLFKEEL